MQRTEQRAKRSGADVGDDRCNGKAAVKAIRAVDGCCSSRSRSRGYLMLFRFLRPGSRISDDFHAYSLHGMRCAGACSHALLYQQIGLTSSTYRYVTP